MHQQDGLHIQYVRLLRCLIFCINPAAVHGASCSSTRCSSCSSIHKHVCMQSAFLSLPLQTPRSLSEQLHPTREERWRRFIFLHLFSLTTSCGLTSDLSRSDKKHVWIPRRRGHKLKNPDRCERERWGDGWAAGGSKGKMFDRIRADLGSVSRRGTDACCISEVCYFPKYQEQSAKRGQRRS